MTGEDPPAFVDHRDGDKINNRWGNFRHATNGQNIQNAKLRKDNTTGVKGVTWREDQQRYRAIITADGIHYQIGGFKKLADAETAITAARAKLHGEFARAA